MGSVFFYSSIESASATGSWSGRLVPVSTGFCVSGEVVACVWTTKFLFKALSNFFWVSSRDRFNIIWNSFFKILTLIKELT